jgi:hypothetical protein
LKKSKVKGSWEMMPRERRKDKRRNEMGETKEE